MNLVVVLGIEDARIARGILYQNHTDCSQIWKVIIFSLLEAWSADNKFLCLPSYITNNWFSSFPYPDNGSIRTLYYVFGGETVVLPFDRVLGISFLLKCFWSKWWYCLTLRPEDRVRNTLCSVSELKQKTAKKTLSLRVSKINLILETHETLKKFREGSEGSTRSSTLHYSCYLIHFVFCIHNINCSKLRTSGLYEVPFLHIESILLVPQCTSLDSDPF